MSLDSLQPGAQVRPHRFACSRLLKECSSRGRRS
jgi:hypothetical protein